MSRATQRSTSSRPFSSTLAQRTFHLHPKQGVAFYSTATEILYSGAAGGSKSARGGDLLVQHESLPQLVALALLARAAIHQHGRRAARHVLSWPEALEPA